MRPRPISVVASRECRNAHRNLEYAAQIVLHGARMGREICESFPDPQDRPPERLARWTEKFGAGYTLVEVYRDIDFFERLGGAPSRKVALQEGRKLIARFMDQPLLPGLTQPLDEAFAAKGLALVEADGDPDEREGSPAPGVAGAPA